MTLNQKDKLAEFFYKLAEYTFAGLVIGAFISRSPETGKNLAVGGWGTLLFALLGFYLNGRGRKRK